MEKFILKSKVWLSSESGEGIMGIGKLTLLKKIRETGSISMAAKELNISYRKAWGDIKKAEEFLGVKLLDKHRGGKHGGQTFLTEKGISVITAFDSFFQDYSEIFDKSSLSFINELNQIQKDG